MSFSTTLTNPSDNVATFATFSYAAWIETKFFFCLFFDFSPYLSVLPDLRTHAVPSRTAIGIHLPTVKWTISCNGFNLRHSCCQYFANYKVNVNWIRLITGLIAGLLGAWCFECSVGETCGMLAGASSFSHFNTLHTIQNHFSHV
jgi:hypothetical protein